MVLTFLAPSLQAPLVPWKSRIMNEARQEHRSGRPVWMPIRGAAVEAGMGVQMIDDALAER